VFLELLKIDRDSEKPIYRQIVDQTIDLIRTGILAAGMQIPGTRKIAGKLILHRKTVVAAIDELVAQGWLESTSGIGTFVPQTILSDFEILPGPPRPVSTEDKIIMPTILDRSIHLTSEQFHLDDGLPDPRLAPVDELIKAYKTALTTGLRYPKYTYGDPSGHILLREKMSEYLFKTRGMRIDRSQILITRGVTQALYLTIKGFIKQGDQVGVPALNWESANINFMFHGAKLINIRVDAEGFDVDHLEEICQEQEIKMVFVTPHHHYPTTVIMPAYRRVKLLNLARRFRFYVFEDDYDYDFHYARHPIMPLASVNNDGTVFYAGSFTKAIAPVFRIGYLVGTPTQIDYLSRLRRLVDRQGDAILELAVAELLELGVIQRYLRKNRKIYQARRDHFESLLRSELGSVVAFDLPEGGMSFWTKFSEDIDLKELAAKALSKDLYLQDGSFFKMNDSRINATRLGFASSTEEEMLASISILKGLI
jgi:GntR family transcriptional regulator/MocR family aminotransferase